MYIKKKDRQLFKELDDNLILPRKWEEFISKRVNKNGLILKLKKKFYLCVHCKIEFEEEDIKVNDYCKCPNCENHYLVKSNRLQFYEFKDELAILDRYKDYYVVRQFRLHTTYKKENKNYYYGRFSNYYYEYGRVIYDEKLYPVEEIINENVVGTINGWFISFRNFNSIEWRYMRSYYYYLPNQLIYYPYNLEQVLSDIKKLKYSQLWELVKHVDYLDLIYLINNYNPSVELLTKLGLYNLALCPKSFANKKSFNDRFMGLSKDYIPFIREYNLDIDELTVLSYLKVKNINYIKRCSGLTQEQLKDINRKVNIISLLNKTDFDKNKFYEYRDYLSIAKQLKLNMKDKTTLYPKNIKKAHDKVVKEYEEKKDKMLNNSIIRRGKQLKCNIYQNKTYIIFPATTYDSLIDESSQQNNCVRTYAERIAKGECDIYFMRLSKDREHSLVTVEVKDNKVVQKRTKNNQVTTKSQNNFLQLWEDKILKGVRNEKRLNENN
ncbi:MAG: PcfJ domain-containing protein [Bacilli bacterium]|nr:PcfJ domain-containing protein [Bacilli bacterium]